MAVPGIIRTVATLELVGNALCLDFANTLNVRPEPDHDYLATAADLVDWAERAGAITAPVADRLRGRAGSDPAVVRAVHRLRDTVHRTFSAIAAGRAPAEGDLARVLAAHADAMAHATLRPVDDGFALTWAALGDSTVDSPVEAQLLAVLHPVAASAVDLLRSPLVARVKECPACGWLFVDLSRNRTRRWCSMQTCGSRDKMRRLYRRQRAAAGRDRQP